MSSHLNPGTQALLLNGAPDAALVRKMAKILQDGAEGHGREGYAWEGTGAAGRGAEGSASDGGAFDGSAIEVDIGAAVPVSYLGLRQLLQCLKEAYPDVVLRVAGERPIEWERLFPGTFPGHPSLESVALSPSERRLHRESEQVFQVLNVAAHVIVETLRVARRPLILRNAGACDLVSLRGLMRVVERGSLEKLQAHIILADWDTITATSSDWQRYKWAHFQGLLSKRMGTTLRGEGDSPSMRRPVTRQVSSPELEGLYLAKALDSGLALETRVAAACLGIMASFYTTGYEVAMICVETGLELLREHGPRLDYTEIQRQFELMDDRNVDTQAVEIDAHSLTSYQELLTLLHRSAGVVRALSWDTEDGLQDFARALETAPRPEISAQIRMFRALSLAKRLRRVEDGQAEIRQGLQGLEGRTGQETLLEEGWLRNVFGLTYFAKKDLEAAFAQEKRAVACVGGLHDSRAAHLKINLISNISVLQENAGRYTDALKTWGRFSQIGTGWGDSFFMHHQYRGAGLNRLAGNMDLALEGYEEAYRSAVKLGTDYYQQAIAGELGKLYWTLGQPERAVHWYDTALAACRKIGDPLSLGELLTGCWIVKGGEHFRDEALQVLPLSFTFPREAQKLLDVLSRADREACLALLPGPRTKLNRPFDLVNL